MWIDRFALGFVGAPERVTTTAGWRTPSRELIVEFTQDQRRAPKAGEIAVLRRLAARNNEVLRRMTGGHSPSRTDEMDFNTAQGLINFYLVHGRGPDDKDPVAPTRGGPEIESLVKAAVSAVPSKKSFIEAMVDVVVDTAGDIIHEATELYTDVEDLVGKIPFVGAPLHAALDLAGGSELRAADAIAHGANISKTALSSLKETLANAKTVADTVTTLTAFVPGLAQVGAGLDGALAAAHSLSSGANISDAMIEAGKSALYANIPGGAVARKLVEEGVEVGIKIAKGERLDKIALERVRAQLPKEVQKGFDVTVAIARGQKLQNIALGQVQKLGPEALGKLASEGGVLLKQVPSLANAAKGLDPKGQEGFKLASSVLARTGVSPKTLSGFRAKIAPAEQKGFDRAVAFHAKAAAAAASAKIAAAASSVKLPGSSAPSAATVTAAQLAQLAKLTPAQQKQLIDYANLQKLAQLTPAQQQQLVAYAKAKAPAPSTKAPAMRDVPQAKIAQAKKESSMPSTTSPAASTSPRSVLATYAPYPKAGSLSAPPHGGGHHGGHGGHGGGHGGWGGGGGHHFGRPVRPSSRGGGFTRWPGWWDWGIPWSPEVVTTTQTCQTWGDPIEMPQAMQTAAKAALGASSGKPTTVRGPDGVLYLFAVENGVQTARPCATIATVA